MKQIATLLLLVVVAAPMAAKWKTKEKPFDRVAITDVRMAAGRYVGIDPDYVINLRLDGSGALSGTLAEFGVASPLRDIHVTGAEIYATVGGLPIHGTFVKRTRNGVATFGLLVHDAEVKIEDVTLSEIFCRKA